MSGRLVWVRWGVTLAQVASVAILGTGVMGSAMGRNLVAAGHEVRVWNRTRDKATAIEEATVADDPGAAALGADVLMTMLADARAVEESVELEGFGGVWAQMSTVGLEDTTRLSELAAAHDVPFFDAPVLGTRPVAEQGAVVVLAAGPSEARATVEPVFSAVGRRTVWLDGVGAGTRLKLVLQCWNLLMVTGVAQAMALAERLGVAADAFLEATEGHAMTPAYTRVEVPQIANRAFQPPNFTLGLARKDAALVLQAAGDLRLPLLKEVAAAQDRAIELGHAHDDVSAVVTALI